MLAGRAMGEQFRATGGWIGNHPYGGLIQEGSGTRDDVLLGYTPGARHWGMGGEYVINKESTGKHRQLLELINRDRGLATGGYLDRTYQGGAILPWEPVADSLAIGGAGSAIHGFIKGGGFYGAIAELITFFTVAIPAMFAGKFLANQFKAEGGMLDVGHGLRLPGLPRIFDPILAPLKGLPIIGPIITLTTDPEGAWEYIKNLIRLPLEQIAKDLVTPGIYYPSGIDTIKTILKGIPEVLGFQQGGILPRTGFFYGHGGERVLSKEDTRAYEGAGITINSPLIHIGGNLIADKQVFDDFVEDIEYALDKRSKRVYA